MTDEPDRGAPIKVLVAEGDDRERRMIVRLLRRWGYEVLATEDGRRARKLLVRHPGIRLLIVDQALWGCSGEDLCRFARTLQRPRYLHILMLASRQRRHSMLTALESGADAFLARPVEIPELQAQVKVARRVLDLDDLNWRRLDEIEAVHQRIQRDLEAAARVQQSFLPEKGLALPGVRSASLFRSTREVAGDMFNVVTLPDGRVAAWVLDVSGHGTQAALLSVSIHLFLESLTLGSHSGRLTASGSAVPLDDPVAVLRALNERFPVMVQSGQYFTMIYGVLDPARGTFDYARGGHPWPIVVGAEEVRLLEEYEGQALGMYRQVHLESLSVALGPGEMVLLYSDGLLEARGHEDPSEEFGPERILQVVEEHRAGGVDACVEALREALERFTGPLPPRDDVTVLGLEVL